LQAHRSYLRARASCLGLAASLKRITPSIIESANAACLASQLKNPSSITFSAFDDKQGYDGNTPGAEYLANCYVNDFQNREQWMRLLRQQVYGLLLRSDHTFYITKKVFVDNHRAFHSLFEVMNEYEEIITSVMLQGTGFAELRVAMQKLHARFETFKPNAKPKYWYVDDDACEAGVILEYFKEVHIILDAFHLMKRYGDSTVGSQHPAHSEFLSKLSAAIFTTNRIDLHQLRDTLGIQGADDAVFQSVTKAQLRRFCRRDMNPKVTLIDNLNLIFKHFQELAGDEPLFTQKTHDVHAATIEHINAGRFFDPTDLPLYAEKTVLKNGLRVWRCMRGTSQLEGFHGHLRRWLRAGIMSPVLLHALLQDAIAQWNHNCGVRNRRATDFKICDHSVLEDINALAKSVGAPAPYDLVAAGWGLVRKELDTNEQFDCKYFPTGDDTNSVLPRRARKLHKAPRAWRRGPNREHALPLEPPAQPRREHRRPAGGRDGGGGVL